MNKIIIVILSIIVMGLLVLAFKEPSPGVQSLGWELSGDWSLKIGSSWFEVGNSLEYSKKYEFFQVMKSESSNQYRLKPIVDGIDRIASNSAWVLAKMEGEWKLYSYNKNEKREEVHTKGWFWFSLYTGDTYWGLNDEDFKAKAPDDVRVLEASLKKPHKSDRNKYLFFTGLIIFILLYCIWKAKKSAAGVQIIKPTLVHTN